MATEPRSVADEAAAFLAAHHLGHELADKMATRLAELMAATDDSIEKLPGDVRAAVWELLSVALTRTAVLAREQAETARNGAQR